MKIDMRVDARAVTLQLDRLRADVIGPAASRALNRTATSVRAEAVRAMRRTLPLSAKSLRSRLKIESSNQRTLTARIVARRDYDPSLGQFSPTWRQRQPGGATVKLPGRPRQAVAGAFVARTRYGRDAVFRRVGRARTPLQFLRASDIGLPTVSAAFLQAAGDAALTRYARDKFRGFLAREIQFRRGA